MDIIKKLHTTKKIISKTITEHQEIAVAFSGGRDSQVLLEITREVCEELRHTPLPVVFLDLELIYESTAELAEYYKKQSDIRFIHLCPQMKWRNAFSLLTPHIKMWDQNAIRKKPENAITFYEGWQRSHDDCEVVAVAASSVLAADARPICLLLGCRAEESPNRAMSALKHPEENPYYSATIKKSVHTKVPVNYCWPIQNWRRQELDVYIKSKNIQINKFYTIAAALGIRRQRISVLLSNDASLGIEHIKRIEPATYHKIKNRGVGEKMVMEFESTAIANMNRAIPSRTKKSTTIAQKLFSEGIQLLKKCPDPIIRDSTSRIIKNAIDYHRRMTDDPIGIHTKHPISGLYFSALMRFLSRGEGREKMKTITIGIPRSKINKIRAGDTTLLSAGRIELAKKYITEFEELYGKKYDGELNDWL